MRHVGFVGGMKGGRQICDLVPHVFDAPPLHDGEKRGDQRENESNDGDPTGPIHVLSLREPTLP